MRDLFSIPVAHAELWWPKSQHLTGNEERRLAGLDTSIEKVLQNFLGVFLSISLIAATAAILYASYMLITARGDAAVKKKAEDMMIWALVGVVVMLFAYSIVSVAIGLPLFSRGGTLEPIT